jgi:hypothetical protein
MEPMNRTEKKRAELSISDKSLRMAATEIAIARHLTRVTFDWLSRKETIPYLEHPIAEARLTLIADGDPSIVEAIEQFSDLELVSSVTIGAVYMKGEPRRPNSRFLPSVSDTHTTAELRELKYFEAALEETHAAGIRKQIDRVADVFRKRLRVRKSRLTKRMNEVLGYNDGGRSFDGRPVTDDMIQSFEYMQMLAWLDSEERTKEKPTGSIRSWRG